MTFIEIARYLIWVTGFCCVFSANANTGANHLNILTSIKPLALIAQEILGEHGRVNTLLPITGSPHDYPLKISDVRNLHKADLVLWVGPELETFLAQPLGNLSEAKTLSVFGLPGLFWPESELHDVLATENHLHERDPHLWLDPRNAAIVARAIAQKLGVIRPELTPVFLANAERFALEMETLDQRLSAELAPIKQEGFAVYHEGYLHFVDRYQLRQLGYVTYAPERRPGAKHLYQLRQSLIGRASCLFIEPYYDSGGARKMAKELGLRIGVLDPIGGEHIQTYEQLLIALAGEFLACLKAQPT
jgi:zinc transport system substrate-binding protein